MGANSYLRLTNLRDSKDFAYYQECLANGWDIRLEGWMPAVLQWGANLKYEQYYGKEVALFGKDNRQKDPHAVTVGVNYTPFPLLTLSADQHQGKAGQNDIRRLGMQFNIQLGTPWRHQFDSSAVGAMRTLSGLMCFRECCTKAASTQDNGSVCASTAWLISLSKHSFRGPI